MVSFNSGTKLHIGDSIVYAHNGSIACYISALAHVFSRLLVFPFVFPASRRICATLHTLGEKFSEIASMGSNILGNDCECQQRFRGQSNQNGA